MRFVACCLVASACGFSAKLSPAEGDGGVDAAIDAPPASPKVYFTTIASPVDQIRPGTYGFEITATLHNELPNEITNVAATLTFATDTTDRAGDFRWRDTDARENVMTLQPQTVPAGGDVTFQFEVDALPWAVPPGPVVVNGAATFKDGATPLSASPSTTPKSLAFPTMNAPIVVNLASDESNGNNQICLREALARAGTQVGPDRIVFDPTVFPPGAPVTTLLSEGLGELNISSDVVIDGRGAGVILAVDSGWENPEGRYGFRINGGTVVISHITMKDFAFNYRNEGDLSGNNCGPSNAQLEGGAIRIDSGTLILDGNTFADPDVAERNCFAASVRVEGGSKHRILGNTWTDQVMDSVYIDAATVEISGNTMNAGGDLTKVDECMYINTQGGQNLWIVGNVCVDMEYSAVIARGSEGGTLYVINNTFARDGRAGLSGVRREQGSRGVSLRNNVYVGDNPSAITVDNSGTGFNVGYESVTGSGLFSGTSTSAVVNSGSILMPANAMLVDSNGTTRAQLAPATGSPLVDSGVDLLDVNGTTPGHYNGTAPDRGAVELP